MRSGLVVVLDGPVHVGRSTTAAALQQRWPEVRPGPLLSVGLDAALRAFGPSERRWRELVGPSEPDVRASRGDDTAHLAYGPLGRELVTGMHRAAAAWARSGIDVVMDHLVPDRATAADLAAALDGLEVLSVGLLCDLVVLEEREREAGRHEPGTAAAQARATRDVHVRDLVLDTTEASTDELVDAILAEVRRVLRS